MLATIGPLVASSAPVLGQRYSKVRPFGLVKRKRIVVEKIACIKKSEALPKTEDEVVDDDEYHRTDKDPGFERPTPLEFHERVKFQEPYREIGGTKICDSDVNGKLSSGVSRVRIPSRLVFSIRESNSTLDPP